MAVVRSMLLIALLVAGPLVAQTPTKARPFSLLQRASAGVVYTPNRTSCGLTPIWIGPDINVDGIFGCGWPSGTSNQYVFNSGLQLAGMIGPDGGPWAGDTTGGFFFDPKGTTEHGVGLTSVFLSNVARDTARWPAAAHVPGGAEGNIYLPAVQGRRAASDLDAWALSWEGDATRGAGRTHPLGVLVEVRALGWNIPRGNEDIQYYVFTLYNITASDPSAYAGARPELRPTLLRYAADFRTGVANRFGVTLPAAGYSITDLYAALSMDADVGDAGSNLASVNGPVGMGYTYQANFGQPFGWKFDPTDYSRPHFRGAGLIGVKVLEGVNGAPGIHLFSSTGSGGEARDVRQLYRYLSGMLDPAAGDPGCNVGDPLVSHICFLGTSPRDIRTTQSTGPATLTPGGFTRLVVAYVYAAPSGTCPAPCNVSPGDPLRIGDATLLASGANQIDSLTGYTGFTDLNGDGVVQGGELRAVPRSLLAKAQMAQALFDTKFQLPEAPAAPDFYLVPGDGQVTVLWKPSPSEATGDPYFATVSTPTLPGANGAPVINPLYDPNYRQFDVEGYRVYRGRTADPGEMMLVAQYDYQGTVIRDYTGRVNPQPFCAPDLGIHADCPTLDSLVPGVGLTVAVEYPLVQPLIQEREGDRIPLPDGSTFAVRADTLLDNGLRCLCDTGVPFMFVDSTVRNSFQYYYSVVAFDVNSLQSGPSSQESVRRLRVVRPVRPGVTVETHGEVTWTLRGRQGVLTDTIEAQVNPVTGTFDKPAPPANAWSLSLLNLAPQVLQGSREVRIRLDSLRLGQTNLLNCCTAGREGIPVLYYLSLSGTEGVTQLTVPIQQEINQFTRTEYRTSIPLFPTDSALALQYGGLPGTVNGELAILQPSTGDMGDWGINAVSSGAAGRYNGARWFEGPSPQRNEVGPHPTSGNCGAGGLGCTSTPSFNNAGSLPGVTTVYQPLAYLMFDREWRNIGESQAGARRAADYNVYWGLGGFIDSVIDITHDVIVPFSTTAGGTWGILNTSGQGNGGHDGRPGVLTPTDWSCVEPFRSQLTQPTASFFPCNSPAPFLLRQRAELGVIAFGAGNNNNSSSAQSVTNPANLSAEPGFALYLAGTITHFGLRLLPVPGTVWSLRDYTGRINGGDPVSGATPYTFIPAVRPFTAVGVEIVGQLEAGTVVAQARDADLKRVHTVPDPFYLTSSFDEGRIVRFVNLPPRATIRIYSAGGTLVQLLDHNSATLGSEAVWDLRSRSGHRVASGVYFYHIESGDARRVGRMTIVNYVQ